jgi:HEAT repeat protein
MILDDVEHVRITAAGALVRLQQFTTVAAAVDGLEDPRADVRKLVAGTLGRLKDKSAESALIDTLRDPDEMVRAEVAQALATCGTETSVPSLVDSLHDPSVAVRTAAASSLGYFVDPAIPTALTEAIKDPDWHVRAAAAISLAKVGKEQPAATKVLIGKLRSDEFALVRDRAADGLGYPNDEEAVSALVDSVVSDNRDARVHAAKMLINSKAVSALPKLMEHRRNPDPEIRLKIIEIIGALGGHEQTPAVLEATSDPDLYVRLAAISALRHLQEQGVTDVVKERLNDPSSHVRAQAARALGDLGDKSSVQALVTLLRDDNGFVRGAAAEALGKLGDITAVPSLVQVLTGDRTKEAQEKLEKEGLIIGTDTTQLPEMIRQKRVEEKVKAVQALGEIGDQAAADPIIEYGLRGEDPTLRAESAIALGKMRVEKAVEPLKETVAPYYQDVPAESQMEDIIKAETAIPDTVRLMRERESRVRASVAWALGQIGDSSAIPTLNRALNDPNSLVRDAAGEALAKISERQEGLVSPTRPRAAR